MGGGCISGFFNIVCDFILFKIYWIFWGIIYKFYFCLFNFIVYSLDYTCIWHNCYFCCLQWTGLGIRPQASSVCLSVQRWLGLVGPAKFITFMTSSTLCRHYRMTSHPFLRFRKFLIDIRCSVLIKQVNWL